MKCDNILFGRFRIFLAITFDNDVMARMSYVANRQRICDPYAHTTDSDRPHCGFGISKLDREWTDVDETMHLRPNILNDDEDRNHKY